MSIDTAVARVQEIVQMQQRLLAGPAAGAASAAAAQTSAPAPATATAGASPTFAEALSSAQTGMTGTGVSGSASVSGTTQTFAPFIPHGGQYGFFPAPGKDYSVGQEPEIAARLDALGRALHLHLVGISGYRTPAHSVAVGGFADDPHTRGAASDTPGVENVPEATLRQFGLTRPFSGASEADHIQLA